MRDWGSKVQREAKLEQEKEGGGREMYISTPVSAVTAWM